MPNNMATDAATAESANVEERLGMMALGESRDELASQVPGAAA